jgi:hypothetical protein
MSGGYEGQQDFEGATLAISAYLAAISRWIDCSPVNVQRTEMEGFLLRAIKVFEEAGEMVAAIIGMTGQNPRKGVTHSMDDVIDESLDSAASLLMLVESATGNRGESLPRLFAKIEKVYERMLAVEAEPHQKWLTEKMPTETVVPE